jgi:hypothetical protein
MRILMRVFCEDWFCLTNAEEPVIEALITTGYLATHTAEGRNPVSRLQVTASGMAYLDWLLINDPISKGVLNATPTSPVALSTRASSEGQTAAARRR